MFWPSPDFDSTIGREDSGHAALVQCDDPKVAQTGNKGGSTVNWYLTVLQKYAVFSGRAQRAEYWFFVLFSIIISIVLAILDGVFGTLDMESGLGVLSGIYGLAVFIPSLAVSVRRLHDTSRSGWWILIGLIPFIGAIVVLVFMVLDSTPGENDYGPNPKGA